MNSAKRKHDRAKHLLKARIRPKAPTFQLETIKVVQVRYFETMYKIRDNHGDVIFTGSEESARRILKLLKSKSK